MLSVSHLETLRTVVRTGSFAEAGRELGYTGSAVSQQIAALESVLRAPLFERGARSVRPTALAEYLVVRADTALAAMRDLEDDLTAHLEGRLGRLRIGSFPSASEHLVPSMLSALARRHPDVDLHLDEGEPDELLSRLGSRELDLAIVYRYDLVPHKWPKDLLAEHLLHEQLLLLAPDGHWSESRDVRLEDLREDPWVTTRQGTAMATVLRRICAQSGFDARVLFRSNDYDVIHALVAGGTGIALVPAMSHLGASGTRGVPVAGVTVRRTVSVLRPLTTLRSLGDSAVRDLRAAARSLASDNPHIELA